MSDVLILVKCRSSDSIDKHFSCNSTSKVFITQFKNWKSVVKRCHKFYGKRFATDPWYFSTDVSANVSNMKAKFVVIHYLNRKLWSTKRQWQVLTKTAKLQAMSTISGTTWTLKAWLVLQPITMSEFSLKPGTLLWTWTLGMIISFFQKPTKALHKHDLCGHTCKLCAMLL